MEEILIKWWFWLLIVAAAAVVIHVIRLERYIKKFQKTAGVSDLAAFYIGEERTVGSIVGCDFRNVLIRDITGKDHLVKRSEIYPVIR